MGTGEIHRNLLFKSVIISVCLGMLCLAQALLAQPIPTPAPSLTLKVFATTMTQIVLKWDDPSENAISYELQRDTGPSFSNPTKYTFAKDSMNFNFKLFSDTNRTPESTQQFSGLPQYALLDRNTTYYYRLTAARPSGYVETSSAVSAKVSEPVRGVEGDLWADVVIGKPDFAQNSQRKTNTSASRFAGGVLIDHNLNKMYIADTNNNRILGIDRNSLSGYSKVGPIPEEDNLARGASYTKSIPPDANYPDTGNAEFTDGQSSATWTNSFGYYLGGTSPKAVDITVDLGGCHDINFTSFSSGGGTPGYAVGALTVYVSSDGTHWTEAGTHQNTDRQGEIIIVFLPTASARYVKFHAVSQRDTNGVTDWLFIGEGRAGLAEASAIQEQLSMTPCAKNSDCCCGNHCEVTENPSHPADIVIGQPEMENHSAGNGDSTCQTFPYRAPARSATLCLIHPTQISMAETTTWINMAVDEVGNLYVPDIYNNRVVKYDSPFENDAIADEVWGQDDFTGNEYNKGMSAPTAGSLNLTCGVSGVNSTGTTYTPGRAGAGVDIDRHGNLWVADIGNHRVLRFPKVGGEISKAADLVLGQSSFTTKTAGNGTSLSQLRYPVDVEIDKTTDRVYVPDGFQGSAARILVFDPPFSNGMAATQSLPMPMERELNPSFAPHTEIDQLRLDNTIHGLWVLKSSFTTELFNLDTNHSVTSVLTPQATAMDIDASGNLFVVSKWNDLYRYTYPSFADRATVFPGGAVASADTTDGIWGMTVWGQQLIVADGPRIVIWNNYTSPDSLANGQAAHDLYGDADFPTLTYDGYYAFPQTDTSNRLWVSKSTGNKVSLLAFTYPLTHTSVPAKEITLTDGSLNLLGGGSIRVKDNCNIDFAMVGSGDRIWVADRWNNRVFRISNINGGQSPYVDVVLGQANLSGTACNRGLSHPQSDTLAYPYNVTVSPDGNLYVSDNGGEVGSNHRILQFDASIFPDAPSQILFGIPASRVIGAGGNFNILGYQSSDPICSPYKIGFRADGAMVAPMNGYSSQRFALVYLDPMNEQLPQMAMGDFLAYPAAGAYFDPEGNLYIGDFDWSRLLIYKKPFKDLSGSSVPAPPPVAPTTAQTSTPTATPEGAPPADPPDTRTPTATEEPNYPPDTLTPEPTSAPTLSPTETPTPTPPG